MRNKPRHRLTPQPALLKNTVADALAGQHI